MHANGALTEMSKQWYNGIDLTVKQYHRGQLVREVRLSRPQTMVARDRTTLDVAYPGDVLTVRADLGYEISVGGEG